MEEENADFDLIIEGTTLKEAFRMEKENKILVIDKSTTYGTTCPSLESLLASRYVENIRVLKNIQPRDGQRLAIESLPFILSKTSRIVHEFSNRPYGGTIEYIDINQIFFNFKNEMIWLPKNKTELINNSNISNIGKNIIYRAFKMGDITILQKIIDDPKSEYKSKRIAECILQTHTADEFKELSIGFGSVFYLYPVFGTSELSENISMINSLNGCAYLLSDDLEITKTEGEYGYLVSSKHGIARSKDCVRQTLQKGKSYVRLVNLKGGTFNKMCIGYVLNREIIKVLVLDSKAKVCEKDTELIYFICRSRPVTSGEVEIIIGKDREVLLDIEFETIYDLDQLSKC